MNTRLMSSLINEGRMEGMMNAKDEKIIWKKDWEKVKRKEKIHVEWFMIGHHSKFPLMTITRNRMTLRWFCLRMDE